MASLLNQCVTVVRSHPSNTRRFYHLFTKLPRTANYAKIQETSLLNGLYCNSMVNSKISQRNIAMTNVLLKKARANITFVKPDGQRLTGTGREGDSLLDVVVNNDLDIKGYGACEGTLSCSTCHLIFKPEDFEKLDEKATDEELDMLDLALDVCETSRLGCQVTVTKDMEGLEVRVPADIRDARGPPETSEFVKT